MWSHTGQHAAFSLSLTTIVFIPFYLMVCAGGLTSEAHQSWNMERMWRSWICKEKPASHSGSTSMCWPNWRFTSSMPCTRNHWQVCRFLIFVGSPFTNMMYHETHRTIHRSTLHESIPAYNQGDPGRLWTLPETLSSTHLSIQWACWSKCTCISEKYEIYVTLRSWCKLGMCTT